MSRAGIYRIVNTINGKQYIGSTVDVLRRGKQHFRLLRRGVHHSAHLQSAWEQYGEAAFRFEFLWSVDATIEALLMEEQTALNLLPSEYNSTTTAVTALGRRVSAATRAKISAAHRGRKHSPAIRRRMSDAQRGKTFSAEGLKHMSAAQQASAYRQKNKKPVVSVCPTTGSINLYGSLTEAARSLGIRRSNIQQCLKGARRTAYGYRWRYATEEDLQAPRSAAMAV